MSRLIDDPALQPHFERLRTVLGAATGAFPDVPRRQPVHTVYGGAHLFRHDVADKLGAAARRHLAEWAPDWVTFARAHALTGADRLPTLPREREAFERALDAAPDGGRATHRDAWIAREVYRRTREKLEREPVEDFRVDFEDGFGPRSDAEEDAAADDCAEGLAHGLELGTLPPFVGVRPKAFDHAGLSRALRTLERVLDGLLRRTGGTLPSGFVVTLPKVSHVEQPAVLDRALAALEARHGLPPGTIPCELMVELPACLFDAEGRVPLRALVAAAGGRCRGAHLGAYDYTAALGVSALHQSLAHPAAALARAVMQAALAGTGVMIADGAVTRLPLPPATVGRAADGAAADAARRAVHEAMRAHHAEVRRALVEGIPQGWDVHPGQLATRHAAVVGFFLEGHAAAVERLRAFAEQAARASRAGQAFDDAATARALVHHFARGAATGALREEDLATPGLADDLAAVRARLGAPGGPAH